MYKSVVVDVFQGYDLKSVSLIASAVSNPYCVLTYDTVNLRTSNLIGSATAAPFFGSRFLVPVTCAADGLFLTSQLRLTIFDHKEREVGFVDIDLDQLIHSKNALHEYFQLKCPKGPAGFLEIKIVGTLDEVSANVVKSPVSVSNFSTHGLRFYVRDALDLNNVELPLSGKMDPFLRILNNDLCLESTPLSNAGHESVQFNSVFDILLKPESSEFLIIEVWDHNKLTPNKKSGFAFVKISGYAVRKLNPIMHEICMISYPSCQPGGMLSIALEIVPRDTFAKSIARIFSPALFSHCDDDDHLEIFDRGVVGKSKSLKGLMELQIGQIKLSEPIENVNCQITIGYKTVRPDNSKNPKVKIDYSGEKWALLEIIEPGNYLLKREKIVAYGRFDLDSLREDGNTCQVPLIKSGSTTYTGDVCIERISLTERVKAVDLGSVSITIPKGIHVNAATGLTDRYILSVTSGTSSLKSKMLSSDRLQDSLLQFTLPASKELLFELWHASKIPGKSTMLLGGSKIPTPQADATVEVQLQDSAGGASSKAIVIACQITRTTVSKPIEFTMVDKKSNLENHKDGLHETHAQFSASDCKCVRIVCCSAKNLPNVEIFGEIDPYVRIQYAGSDLRSQARDNAGCHPELNYGFYFEPKGHRFAKVTLYDKQVLTRDRVLAEASLDLVDLHEKSNFSGKQTKSLELTSPPHLKYNGPSPTVNLVITMLDTIPAGALDLPYCTEEAA